MSITSYKELKVWQISMDIAEQVYRLTQDFPKQETYGLTSQVQRAAVSIPSNLAEVKEGSGIRGQGSGNPYV